MSTNCGCTSPGSYSQCAGFQLKESVDIANFYAQKVGAPSGKNDSKTCDVRSLVVNVIMAQRLPYYGDNPGDCGKDTKVSITGAGASKAIGIGSTVAGTFGSIAGIATGTGASISSGLAAGGLAAAGSIASIAAFGAGLLLIPLAFIGHHSAEVAIEKKVLCSVASGYNSFADQVEALLSSGQMTADQAGQLADQIQQQIISALQSGYKNCNARCYYTYAIKALTMYCKEYHYMMLATAAAQKSQAAAAGTTSGPTSNRGIAIGVGLAAVAVLAKIFL